MDANQNISVQSIVLLGVPRGERNIADSLLERRREHDTLHGVDRFGRQLFDRANRVFDHFDGCETRGFPHERRFAHARLNVARTDGRTALCGIHAECEQGDSTSLQ